MRLALADRTRHPLFFIPQVLHLTFDEPGPVELNVDGLTDQQKQQIVYNIRRGVIVTDGDEELQFQELEEQARITAKSYATPVEAPVQTDLPVQDTEMLLEARKKELRKLLKQTIPTIKAAVTSLGHRDLELLLELEKGGKARKSLLKLLTDGVNEYIAQVKAAVGDIDVADSPHAQMYQQRQLRGDAFGGVSDIVESDEEEVELHPSEPIVAGNLPEGMSE